MYFYNSFSEHYFGLNGDRALRVGILVMIILILSLWTEFLITLFGD